MIITMPAILRAIKRGRKPLPLDENGNKIGSKHKKYQVKKKHNFSGSLKLIGKT